MALNSDQLKIYEKCYDGYQKVEDLRSKLLGFLPIASGLTVLGSLSIKTELLNENFLAIGLFGFVATWGLLIFELKGIEKCTQFIFLGKWIESQMEGNINKGLGREGYFTELAESHPFVNEPIASAFIYSIVLALWSYVGFFGASPRQYLIPTIVFCLFFTWVYFHWQSVVNKIKTRESRKD